MHTNNLYDDVFDSDFLSSHEEEEYLTGYHVESFRFDQLYGEYDDVYIVTYGTHQTFERSACEMLIF